MHLLLLQEHNVGSSSHTPGLYIVSIADHIIYVEILIEYSHVDIGSDCDGVLANLPGLDDTLDSCALVERLVQWNVADEKIKLIVRLSFIRVEKKIEKISTAVRYVEEWKILCDEIATSWSEERVFLFVERRSLRTENGL
jgi:hypothetical protein